MKLFSALTLVFVYAACASARHWGEYIITLFKFYLIIIILGSRRPEHHRHHPQYHIPIAYFQAVDCSIPINQVTLHPHPTSCTHYLQCDHGWLINRPCAPGTEFSPSRGVCVHVWNSDCTAGQSPVPSVPETTPRPVKTEIPAVTTEAPLIPETTLISETPAITTELPGESETLPVNSEIPASTEESTTEVASSIQQTTSLPVKPVTTEAPLISDTTLIPEIPAITTALPEESETLPVNPEIPASTEEPTTEVAETIEGELVISHNALFAMAFLTFRLVH